MQHQFHLQENCGSGDALSYEDLILSFFFTFVPPSSWQDVQLATHYCSVVCVKNSKCDTGFYVSFAILSWWVLVAVVVICIKPCTSTTGTK
jgi:hypothetical protein